MSPYGVTKLAAEQLCRAYAGLAGTPMAVAVLRYCTVYGPPAAARHGLRRFIEAAMAGRPLVVYGDGDQTREFTYVDDVVRASLLAMTAPVGVEAVNIGGRRLSALSGPGTAPASGRAGGPGGRSAARWRRWRRPAGGRC